MSVKKVLWRAEMGQCPQCIQTWAESIERKFEQTTKLPDSVSLLATTPDAELNDLVDDFFETCVVKTPLPEEPLEPLDVVVSSPVKTFGQAYLLVHDAIAKWVKQPRTRQETEEFLMQLIASSHSSFEAIGTGHSSRYFVYKIFETMKPVLREVPEASTLTLAHEEDQLALARS